MQINSTELPFSPHHIMACCCVWILMGIHRPIMHQNKGIIVAHAAVATCTNDAGSIAQLHAEQKETNLRQPIRVQTSLRISKPITGVWLDNLSLVWYRHAGKSRQYSTTDSQSALMASAAGFMWYKSLLAALYRTDANQRALKCRDAHITNRRCKRPETASVEFSWYSPTAPRGGQRCGWAPRNCLSVGVVHMTQ